MLLHNLKKYYNPLNNALNILMNILSNYPLTNSLINKTKTFSLFFYTKIQIPKKDKNLPKQRETLF